MENRIKSSLLKTYMTVAVLVILCLSLPGNNQVRAASLFKGVFRRPTRSWKTDVWGRDEMAMAPPCTPCRDAYTACLSYCDDEVRSSNLPGSFRCKQDCHFGMSLCIPACHG